MNIITNNIPRPILFTEDLTEEELVEFSTLDKAENLMFFKYYNCIYCLQDFERLEQLSKWDGFVCDTVFSGIVIKFTETMEEVIVGRYYQ